MEVSSSVNGCSISSFSGFFEQVMRTAKSWQVWEHREDPNRLETREQKLQKKEGEDVRAQLPISNVPMAEPFGLCGQVRDWLGFTL